jgi:hypothetical protein
MTYLIALLVVIIIVLLIERKIKQMKNKIELLSTYLKFIRNRTEDEDLMVLGLIYLDPSDLGAGDDEILIKKITSKIKAEKEKLENLIEKLENPLYFRKN